MIYYEYLYNQIKSSILSGAYKPGDKLPSKRNLAASHSVSLITVASAYEQLLYEGYITSIEKKGYYVADIESFVVENKPSKISYNLNNSNQTDSNTADDTTNFTSNQPDSNLFPFSTWTRIMRKTILDKGDSLLEKTANQGLYSLRSAIATYLLSSKNIQVNPNNMIIGAGTEYLYSLIVQLLGRDKAIAMEDPGYTKACHVYECNGVNIKHIKIDEYGLIADEISKEKLSAIHISPSHQFPTGRVMNIARRHQLLNYANSNNSYIIEDDYDSEFRFEGRPVPSILTLDNKRVIYMNTFSKSLMNTVRIAYMILPDDLMLKYKEKLSFYSNTVSNFEQNTLAQFISAGHYERHISRTRLYYKKCRKLYHEAFHNSLLHNIASINDYAAGLHFIIKIRGNFNDKNYIHKLKKAGIVINSISNYCYQPSSQYDHMFLINYIEIEKEKLEKIFNSMYQLAIVDKP